MAYADQNHAYKMLGVVLGIFVIGMAVRFIMAGGVIEFYSPDKQLENEIAAELEKQPGSAMLLERLETDFPDAHDDLLETLTRAAKSDGPDTRVTAAANLWIARFFANHRNDFHGAPLDRLDAVIASEEEFLSRLQQDHMVACADYAFGLVLEDDLPEDILAIANRTMDARIAAIKGGRADQQLRLELTNPDREAVMQDLESGGLNPEQLAFISGASDGMNLDDAQACDAAVDFVRTIRAQPDSRRALLISAYVSGGA